MTPQKAKTAKKKPESHPEAKTAPRSGLVPVPSFAGASSAFAYQKALVAANFSFVQWLVGRGGPPPEQSLLDYRVEQTIPDPGTFLDPSGLVQVIIYLPPDERP